MKQFPLPSSSVQKMDRPIASGPRTSRPPYPQDTTPADGDLLVAYWNILRRHKGTVVLMAFLGMAAGILITLPQTPIYQSKTTLEVQDMNDSFLNLSKVNPVVEGGGAGTLMADIQTQIRILQSESLSDRVIEKLKKASSAEQAKDSSRVSAWRRALNLAAPAKKDNREEALKSIARSLKVRAAGQTRIIELVCDSPDRQLAASFANNLANEYIEQNMQVRWEMTERTGVFLTRQLDDMRIKLEHSEDELQAYARKSGLLFTSDKNSVAEEKLRQLQQELSKAQAERVVKQSAYEIASKAAPETLPDVLNDAALREYKIRLTDLRRQRSDLFTVYTSGNTKVKRVDEQIETLETALNRERSAILHRIENDYNEAVRRENLLKADYAIQAKLVTDQSEQSIQYNILKREVDSNRQLYDAMLQKMKESSVAAAMRASNIRVVDPAKVARFPYRPSATVNAALGMLGGILFGICFVVMRERSNRMLQQPGDASFYLDLVELGAIPSGGDGRKPFPYLSRKALETETELVDAKRERMEMVSWQRKPSAMAEAFRAVLTSLLFSGPNGTRPHVLIMTSAGPKEGKTTAVCNLGIALAEVNQRVLLIDADMRRPRLHDVFEVPNECGLSTVLKEREITARSLTDVIHDTAVPGLFIIPSGPSTPSAANLLHLPSLKALLEQLKPEFDIILIDTPPMLQIPDARVVGRLVDGVILVIRAGHTTRDAAIAARERFAADGTPVTGVILNDWNPKSSPNGYYGYYNGYYDTAAQYYLADTDRKR